MKVLLVDPSRLYGDRWIAGELQHLFALYSWVRARCPDVTIDVLDLERELSAPATHDQVAEFLRLARAALSTFDFDLVGISCWSSLHYLASLEIARLCKELNPDCSIVVGGYHPSSLPADFTYEQSPFDWVVVGEGERALEQIIKGEILRTNKTQIVQGTPIELGAHPLCWDEYRYFKDADRVGIWLTRGCPFACGYCLDRLTRWRGYDPAAAIEELKRLKRQLPRVRQVNLLDPIFGVNQSWRREFLSRLREADLDLGYWGETRVDVLDEDDVRLLGELRFQMDLGLDSVSPKMIEVMMKARHPDRYVQSFIATDEAMTRHRVPHMIYSILNYPGETPETLEETRAFWLRYCHEHPGSAGALSVQSFKYFPGCEVYERFASYEQRYGARVLHPDWWRLRRPNQMELAGQIVASRELAAAGKLTWWATVKEEIESASRAGTGDVIRRELHDWTAPQSLLLDERTPLERRPLALDPDTHWQKYESRQSVLFNYTTNWAFICSERQTSWLESLGDRCKEDHKEDGNEDHEQRRFYRRLLSARFLRPAISLPTALDERLNYRALIHLPCGTLEFALFSQEAPRTAASFVHLARARYYDGLYVETSYPGAYFESGAWLPGGEAPHVLPEERTPRKSRRGSLWMSIGRDGARFAICRAPWPGLDERGAIFGEIIAGAELLDLPRRGDTISKVEILE